MPLSAAFTVEGNANPAAHAVAYGSVVDLALTSMDGAVSIVWQMMGCSHPDTAIPAITAAGVPFGSTASFTMPADPSDGLGRSFVVRCIVSSGYERSIQYGVVGALNDNGLLPIVPGEENWRHGSHGWSLELNQALNNSGGGGGGGDVSGPASSVDDRIATFDGTTGKAIQDGGQTIAQVIAASATDTTLTQVYWVDDTKSVTGTRDGSQAKPFANMTTALAGWIAGGNIGTIYVASVDGDTFTWPSMTGSNRVLRIVGMRDTLGSGESRAYIGEPNATLFLNGATLRLTLENVEVGDLVFLGLGGASLTLRSHNSKWGNINAAADGGIPVVESYFYDSDFYTNTFTFGATLGAPHFHNCLMGNVTFGATGQKCYVVTPTNRNSDHGSAQPFTLAWPSSDAGNKAYLDGVASYLAPTLTNGNEVTMQ